MFMRHHLLRTALAATATLMLAVASGPTALAGIVYGNIGADDSGPLGTTSTTMENGSWVAQGFRTGSASNNNLTVESVTLGMFATGTSSSVTVSLYSGTTEPSGAALYTSAAVDVSGTAKYLFNFTDAFLAPDTNYWVIPSAAQWLWNSGTPAAPGEQNGSGYAYVDTLESTGATPPSGPWGDTSVRYSVSIMAVPEPAALALFGTGAAVVVGRVIRRRRSSGTG